MSSQCVAHSQCPVIVVHPGHEDLVGSAADGQDRLLEPAQILPLVVGYDGSTNSGDALEWALFAAETLGAPVEVVRTWSIDQIPRQFSEEVGYVPDFDHVIVRVRRDLVEETRGLVEQHPNVAVTHSVALSQPAEELIERSKHALMVIVGSRGLGGFAGLLLGSVSTECAAHGSCPIVVVPASSHAEGKVHRESADTPG